jgi:hypothetical protein
MSPDGSKIAYTQEVVPPGPAGQVQGPVQPTYELWMINSNGTSPTLLDNVANSWYVPIASDWAPAGGMLVYYAGNLHTVTTAGQVQNQNIDGSPYEPAWSPDGSPILFSEYNGYVCSLSTLTYGIAYLPYGGNDSDIQIVVGDIPQQQSECTFSYHHPDWQPLGSQATPSPTNSPTPSPTPTPTPSPSPTLGGETGSASPTVTATPSPTDTAAPTSPGETAAPTATPGPTPIIQDVIWGDDQCDEEANPVDSLFTLRFDAGLGTDTGDCPPMNKDITVLQVLPAGIDGPVEGNWGNVDCDAETNPVDSLKILRYDAGFDSEQEEPCPEIGSGVKIQYFP